MNGQRYVPTHCTIAMGNAMTKETLLYVNRMTAGWGG